MFRWEHVKNRQFGKIITYTNVRFSSTPAALPVS